MNSSIYSDRNANANPICQTLLAKGAISEDQLRIALLEQQKSALPIGQLLVQLGFLSESTMREVLSARLGHESVDLAQVIVDPHALALIPKELARRQLLLPLALQGQQLMLAMVNPNNIIALDQVRALVDETLEIVPQLASESDILASIDRHYGFESSIDGILHEIEPDADASANTFVRNEDLNQPVVRLIDALFHEAVQSGASDIHFEPEQSFLRIRYRIDGVLRQVRSVHKSFWPAMLVRLKVMSQMNIAETRAPQDGRISLHLAGRPIDFRVATHPTNHGENVVLRILDRQKGIVPLAQLGLHEQVLQQLQQLISKPEGMLLVTGPTGSGKTTTLYSILNHLNHESVNIMTLEDPVEYPLSLIRQTSVSEAAKLDFAYGIRSMMRQDPDIILVGEIRDFSTAEMAFRASLTGHQVYSTLHSNSAIGAIPRLLDIGVLPDILAGNLNGVIAQRLVRVLCPHCKQAYQPDATEHALLSSVLNDFDGVLYRAEGCEHCCYQGYQGRIAIMELLCMSDVLDELICQRASTRQMRQSALTQDFRPLAWDALRRVAQGITSLAEVRRVVDLGDGHVVLPVSRS